MAAKDSTDGAKAKSWGKFTYAELLDGLRRRLDRAYGNQDGGIGNAYRYLHKHEKHHAKRSPSNSTSDKLKRKLSGKKTSIGKAIRAVLQFARKLPTVRTPGEILQQWSDEFLNSEAAFSLRYGEFDEFESSAMVRLSELLPDFNPNANLSWPGAIGAHQALSLYSQLCIRIHSEVPEEPMERVLEAGARMVLVPALAYAIYQAGSASEPQEHAHALLCAIAKGEKNRPRPTEFTIEPDKKKDPRQIRRADACIQDHAWDRLLRLLESAGADALGETAMRRLAQECARLLESHLEHPHGSELWKDLSRLSSTTPGANDLLVFETMNQLGHKADKGPMRARLYCSRTRFEAILSGYYDHAFREVLRGTPGDIAEHLRAHQGGWRAPEKLSKAFLLSRRCLVPVDSSVEDSLADQRQFASLVSRLLRDCRHEAGPDKGIEVLSSRYLAGFLSNPRFAKPAGFSLKDSHDATEAYVAALGPSPKGSDNVLTSLFRGRAEWVKMLMCDEHSRDTAAIFRNYGAAARALLDERHSDSMDDSEAPVWLIPELISLVSLGEALVETHAYRSKLGRKIGEAKGASLNLSRTIQKIGERHYGVYFNLPAEARRIRMGFLRMAEIGKMTPKLVG